MNYYNYNKRSQYKGAKKRLTLNILIIIAVILAIFAFALVLGNHLKNKLDSTEINRDPIETLPAETGEKDDNEDEQMFLKNNRSPEELQTLSACLDLSGCPDEKTAGEYVEYLKNVGYSGITFNIEDSDGKLAYNSYAVSEIAGTYTYGSVTNVENLKAAAEKAKSLGMKTTALVTLTDISSKDERETVKTVLLKSVVSELGSVGFDEFIFRNATSADAFTSSRADELYLLVSEVRKSLPNADIGLVLDRAILDNPELTPVTELVFRFADFFAIDFSDKEEVSSETVSSFLTSHSGSVNAYNIRFLSGADAPDEIAAEYALYSAGGTLNISFVSPLQYTEKTDEDGKFVFASKMVEYTVDKGVVKKDSTDETKKDN